MALFAHYSNRQEELICRSCRSDATALEQQGLIHVVGSDRIYTQTRVSINCQKCGESTTSLFGGDVRVEDESQLPGAGRPGVRPSLARWLPNLSPLFAWISG
jgi:hypothetical protein